MPADQTRAQRIINLNHTVDAFAMKLNRVLIMLEAAKEALVDGDMPKTKDEVWNFVEEVEAHLEVSTAYLRGLHAEMQAFEALPASDAA